MFVCRVVASRAPKSSYRAQPVVARRRASTAVTTGSKATLPANAEHLSKLQKALETGDAKSVVEVADALNKLSSSLSQDQRALLSQQAAADLKAVTAENPSAAQALKAHDLPHEQLLAALPEWHNTRGYQINSIEELEQHWNKWISSNFKSQSAAVNKLFGEGGADAQKTEVQLFDFLSGLSQVQSKEEAVDYFKKNLPEFLEKPYILGQPNPFYSGPQVGMQAADHVWAKRMAKIEKKRTEERHPWWDFMSGYFQYLVDDGLVNPAVVKQMYALDLTLVQRGSPEAVKALKENFQEAFRATTLRFRNSAKVDEVFGEFSQRLDEVATGAATADSFRMTSLNDDKVQDRYEDLIKNHATFKNLDWETKLHIARTYNLSLGYQTLEWTWPSPPPAHTWVELPVYKPVEDGHHHHHHHQADQHKH